MKSYLTLIVLVLSISLSKGQTLKTANDSLSYALGQDLAAYLKRMNLPVNSTILAKAFVDVLDGKPLMIAENQKDEVIRVGMQRVTEERNAKAIQESKDFFVQNKKVAGIKETPEGIQYLVLKEGTGKQASMADSLVIHYSGSLTNGNKFDSSYDRGEPITIMLDDMIAGWKVAIPLMKEGAKYKFFIPQQLGYGERASGPIPAYSTLVFEVELLEVKSPKGNEPKQSL